MKFKLLAIRPLEGNDPEFTKNLVENCIYRFYNEYDFLTTNSQSYIKYQNDKIKKHKDTDEEKVKLEKLNIRHVESTNNVPSDFYSHNINICAIVGKNGSGKSSILELLYAFIFNISKKNELLDFKDGFVDFNSLNLEIYYEYDNAIYKIEHKWFESDKKDIAIKIFQLGNEAPLNDERQKEILFKFYFLVVNYSIYGLNSKVSGKWIEKLFHKNDGYQSPIVINPFRDEGNIDVNNEFNLAQSRLILNHFIINNRKIFDGIEISELYYQLNYQNAQYIEKYNKRNPEQNLPIITSIFRFLEINNFTIREINDLVDIIFNSYDNENIYSLKHYLKNITPSENFRSSNEGVVPIHVEGIQDLKYLCFLYIFKKLRRISINYKEYNGFNFLFEKNWDTTIFEYGKMELVKEIENMLKIKPKEFILNNNLELDNYINIIQLHYKSKLEFISKDVIYEWDEFTESIRYKIKAYFEEDKIKSLSVRDLVENINIEYKDLIDRFRKNIFKDYIIKLKKDKSHITFKLKQAINYFENDLFNNISFEPLHESNTVRIEINNDYFSDKDIFNIPISFFEPQVKVVKERKIIPFNKLSSGEQQLIHSILNLTYHLFNIKSVNESKSIKKKYQHINIIFDEVELYFHPEYQRKFIQRLIKSLEFFDDFEFNIIFTTHSPFILSDIPSQNTLRLKEGMPYEDYDSINSFGSNIHDLLADEFFLEDGFIGEFASKKINEIYDRVSNLTGNDIEIETLENEINLIGEKVLRQPLRELLEKHIEKVLSRKRLREYYENKLKDL